MHSASVYAVPPPPRLVPEERAPHRKSNWRPLLAVKLLVAQANGTGLGDAEGELLEEIARLDEEARSELADVGGISDEVATTEEDADDSVDDATSDEAEADTEEDRSADVAGAEEDSALDDEASVFDAEEDTAVEDAEDDAAWTDELEDEMTDESAGADD
ncbi:hypothetical protein ACN47E_003783 [Coniothyrium glycines]